MQESFSDYAPGTFTNITPPSTSQNGGLGWNTTGTATANDTGASWGTVLNAGSARSVTAGGLSYTATGYFPASGNKLTLDATSATQNIGRTLGGQTIDSGSTFFSFLINKSVDTTRTFELSFENGTASTAEKMSIGQVGATAGTTNGNIGILFLNTNPADLVQAPNPIAMGVNITHLIIGRVDWNANGANEVVTLWVDPTDVTSQAAAGTAYMTNNAFDLTAFNEIRPFAGTTSGAITAVAGSLDEIRIGGTWESVTSAPLSVPEPTTLLLAGLGGMGLVLANRRRRTG